MKRLKPVALWLATLLVVAFALLYYESDLLWKVQQHNTFLYSSLFFKQTMVVPGGMLSWLGAFFTQFFYYPWQGVLFLCGWWLLLMWLTKQAFNIPEKWKVLTLMPVAILIITNMCLGYWAYLIKLHGYFFMPTLGVTAGTALLWAFRKLPEKLWARTTFIVLTAVVGFPLFGVYALATILLIGIWTWRLSARRKQNGIVTAVALLSVIVIPLIYYRFVYYETNLMYIYSTALPAFSVSENYPDYYIPYYALAACFLLLAVTYRHEWKETAVVQTKEKKQDKKNKKSAPNAPRSFAKGQWILQGCVLAVLVFCVYHFWYKDDNFHHELKMARCVEKTDWEGVVEEGTKQDCEPTRAIVMMHNLALSRLGRQCDEMYKFRKGSSKINTPLPVFMYHIAGRMMLYQYGLANECHRICMEEGVEAGWSVELLQYLARCAIMNKEPQAARKFLDLLRQTQFYGQWADHMEQLMNDSGLMAGDPETGPIIHMLHYSDHLDAIEGYVEKSLMTSLAQEDANDPVFQEQAVIAALWTREPDFFWPRLQHYMELLPNHPLPRIFQEAAYLFGKMEGLEWVEQMPLDQSVKNSFYSFMEQMQKYQSAPSNSMREYIYNRFGSTYFFEYFFLRNITYY